MKNPKINEYGGYLPFETQLTNFNNDFFESESGTIIKLNCGRTCFYVAARSLKIKKLYLPYFTCIDTSQPFKDLGISISYYKLDSKLMPLNINLQKDEYILWTNYYGNATDEIILLIEKKYAGNLIADNCHAFFNPPLKNAVNCYSARKFIGVADGAYIITDLDIDFKINDLVHDKTSPYMEHLFKQGEDGINEGYQLSLLNEKRLEKNYSLMSITTERILRSIDYKKIKKIRAKNFSILHSLLKSLNNFPINSGAVNQMYYPFKCKDLHLREKLIQKKVYNPTWWRHVIDEVGPESIESELTLETVLLPIDQRYNATDMKKLSSIVKELIHL
jgi:hypothetical protein